ncbi:MAG: hypothetical protein ACT4TC_10020, partial [Myxococcaceae bacterium]
MTGPIRSDAQRTREAYANALDQVCDTDGQYELDDDCGPDFENSSFEGQVSGRGPKTNDPNKLISYNRPNREVNTVDGTRDWLNNMCTPELRARAQVVLAEDPRSGEKKLLIAQNGKVYDPNSAGEARDVNQYASVNGLQIKGQIGGGIAYKLLNNEPGSAAYESALKSIPCGPREHFESVISRAARGGTSSGGLEGTEEESCAEETRSCDGEREVSSCDDDERDYSCDTSCDSGPRSKTTTKLDDESTPTTTEYDKA